MGRRGAQNTRGEMGAFLNSIATSRMLHLCWDRRPIGRGKVSDPYGRSGGEKANLTLEDTMFQRIGL